MSSKTVPVTTTPAQDIVVHKADGSGAQQHVLIAIDGSPQSVHAFEWARDHFLDPRQHVVYLLTVARNNPRASMIYSAGVGGGIPWTIIEEENKESNEEAKKIVLHFHHLLKEHFKHMLEVHSLIGQGDARDEIVDAVDKVKADSLILGSRGIGALKRTFLGSTGDYCLHHANCVVIVVKNPPSHEKEKEKKAVA